MEPEVALMGPGAARRKEWERPAVWKMEGPVRGWRVKEGTEVGQNGEDRKVGVRGCFTRSLWRASLAWWRGEEDGRGEVRRRKEERREGGKRRRGEEDGRGEERSRRRGKKRRDLVNSKGLGIYVSIYLSIREEEKSCSTAVHCHCQRLNGGVGGI